MSTKARLALAAAVAMTGAHDLFAAPKTAPRIWTHADDERMAKAEAKRARKAAKRRKLAGKEPGNV